MVDEKTSDTGCFWFGFFCGVITMTVSVIVIITIIKSWT